MQLHIGDYVQANDEAKRYYFSLHEGEEENSDYHRRTLQLGVITDIRGENRSAITVHDLVRGYRLVMNASTLQLAMHTVIIAEQLFDLPHPSYRHF